MRERRWKAILCPPETLKNWRYGGCCFFYLKGTESIVIVLSFNKLISWAFLKGTFYGKNQKLLMFSFLLFPVPLCHFLFPADLSNFTLFASFFFCWIQTFPSLHPPFFFLFEKNEQGTESRGSYAFEHSHGVNENGESSSCRFLSLCPCLYQNIFPPVSKQQRDIEYL